MSECVRGEKAGAAVALKPLVLGVKVKSELWAELQTSDFMVSRCRFNVLGMHLETGNLHK